MESSPPSRRVSFVSSARINFDYELQSSLAGTLIEAIAKFRNTDGSDMRWMPMAENNTHTADWKKRIIAEAAFIVVIPFAMLEACFTGILKCGAFFIKRNNPPQYQEMHRKLASWFEDSLFCIFWAVICSCVNVFVKKNIVTDIATAKKAFSHGNLVFIPGDRVSISDLGKRDFKDQPRNGQSFDRGNPLLVNRAVV